MITEVRAGLAALALLGGCAHPRDAKADEGQGAIASPSAAQESIDQEALLRSIVEAKRDASYLCRTRTTPDVRVRVDIVIEPSGAPALTVDEVAAGREVAACVRRVMSPALRTRPFAGSPERMRAYVDLGLPFGDAGASFISHHLPLSARSARFGGGRRGEAATGGGTLSFSSPSSLFSSRSS